MIPSFSQCRPISNYADIKDCLANPPEWVNRVLPLKKRSSFVIRNNPEDCHCQEDSFNPGSRIDSRTVPKTLVCHDYKGGYQADSYIPFEGQEDKTLVTDGYPFYNWSQIDYFIYFSHHFITIPPLAWVNAGHRNGVKVLGTIITENNEGIKICDEEIFSSSTEMREFVYQLTEIQRTFGFDGWLLNFENKVKNPGLLISFVDILTRKTHEQDSENVVIWYDSVTKNGELKWQNQLSSENRCFFDCCDAIFLNYTWTEATLIKSVEAAGARRFDVFVGIDVFGRGMFGGGMFNTYKATKLARKHDLSIAIFAPGWTHETLEKNLQSTAFHRFLNRDDAFWASLWPYLYTHPINDFFETDFHIGLDYNFYNMYIQKPQISRILYPENLKTIPKYQQIESLNYCACLSRSFFETKNVCLISTDNFEDAPEGMFAHRIFACDIKLSGKIGLYIVTKRLTNNDNTRVKIILRTSLNSGALRLVKLLDEPNASPTNNVTLLEVNPLKDHEIQYNVTLNNIAKRYMKWLNNPRYTGSVLLSMYEFSTTSCNLLDVAATIENGTSIYLLDIGLIQLN
ncbi:cytosolic endo-beta-N-acetylglucosaminidase isoform X2 [Dendroctonus ponderosae]|uniref:Cytosolic endo-beta-N-acetylglucosaminidase TIM barrel domain-containing protein n=2 Tax=Dendroctonus ponderosae TaxID=77166 RepID=U4TV74_DENPD|nr:cytosolic endo-beta-N-acetylglucosaminidase isoform X2 [Dendroctonus ponderosae]XP_048519433.1 cytosolic endo-beta-N-acetylglucosaminidase isoform X2 [Dendroctonus ponderosae]XP_048519434.1 cytosolic endo-beta-N-acetylglucosaminidase isoform X2 [Dendroctonus ponderosae]XP_048519435.1 cytosolic endo-beta-N-acetylglucosaminidase isoform X2 [Dendroctonus ponderosae]XP_048519436.1 cytosolic endo-beta-N-acetylglucosaminidase isoform X2 [Dendroctonus ponderosae]XP_048519437.1 cytosolic endo-beta-